MCDSRVPPHPRRRFGDVMVIPEHEPAHQRWRVRVALLGPVGLRQVDEPVHAGRDLPAVTGGDLLFDGDRVNEVEARDRNVGIVFQSYALYPHL